VASRVNAPLAPTFGAMLVNVQADEHGSSQLAPWSGITRSHNSCVVKVTNEVKCSHLPLSCAFWRIPPRPRAVHPCSSAVHCISRRRRVRCHAPEQVISDITKTGVAALPVHAETSHAHSEVAHENAQRHRQFLVTV
jgi:hypothetical protein